jgi:hypothetical protein
MSAGANDNKISLNFGESSETEKIKADIAMKVHKDVALYFPFQKTESSVHPLTLKPPQSRSLSK